MKERFPLTARGFPLTKPAASSPPLISVVPTVPVPVSPPSPSTTMLTLCKFPSTFSSPCLTVIKPVPAAVPVKVQIGIAHFFESGKADIFGANLADIKAVILRTAQRECAPRPAAGHRDHALDDEAAMQFEAVLRAGGEIDGRGARIVISRRNSRTALGGGC